MSAICEDLPDECWELIINRLDHHSYFESLSLVSKRFLSLTNRLRLRFSVVDPTYLVHGAISKLIHRFPYLKTLDLSKLLHGNLHVALLEIARSSLLNLEALDISNQKSIPIRGLRELGLTTLKNLKVLKCANLYNLCDSDLMAVVDSLPLLEEIDISYPINDLDSFSEFCALTTSEFAVTDCGIEVLSSKLKNLRKANISGNHFLTDKSVLALSTNCLRLREVVILDCSFITLNGLCFILSNSPQLSVISMDGIESPCGPSIFIDAILVRALSTLDFQYSDISDEFLSTIAKACIPLKSISVFRCTGYTMDGIWFLLNTYQSLEFLDLTGNLFLNDQSIIDLSQYLQALVAIKLNSCPKLSESTLYTLAKNCPYLEDIGMRKTNLTKEGSLLELVKNPNIKSLDLAWNSHLSDECLRTIALVCPNLELLDVRSCIGITDGGIAEILRSCREIRHLYMNDCGRVMNMGLSPELPKLEVLLVARSGLNDEGLLTVGKSCSGLVKLNLEACVGVTTAGVKTIVNHCKRLKEINLKGCRKVSVSITNWMVFTRPSLKKIIMPCYDATTENQRKLLLRHGCQICDD